MKLTVRHVPDALWAYMGLRGFLAIDGPAEDGQPCLRKLAVKLARAYRLTLTDIAPLLYELHSYDTPMDAHQALLDIKASKALPAVKPFIRAIY